MFALKCISSVRSVSGIRRRAKFSVTMGGHQVMDGSNRSLELGGVRMVTK